ncbi:hypothetical protein [EBPR siphovirus 5]|nr:hypothetical protein [EBPR siphovirus 5]
MATSRTYRNRRAVCPAHQDAEFLECAKKIGHHGVANFTEAMRQRANVSLTPEYARDLLSRAGFTNPKA